MVAVNIEHLWRAQQALFHFPMVAVNIEHITFVVPMVAVNIEHLWRAQQALSQLCKVAWRR